MSNKNTTPEYELDTEQQPVTREEILMKEQDILAGMLEASTGRENENNYERIQIKRGGKLLFEFRVRPLAEDENQTCFRNATKYAPSKPGQPRVAIFTDLPKYHSYLILAATVNEDRAKTWENKTLMDKLGVLMPVDTIDKVLLAGEKSRVVDKISEISFGDDELEDTAKN
jgi:hypothetical protein